MIAKVDYIKRRNKTMLDKNLKNALSHRLKTEFPRIGGPRILSLCAEMILEVIESYNIPKNHLSHGQIVWIAYAIDDPPALYKKTADSKLIPVILDLSTPEDIEMVIDKATYRDISLCKCIRLCKQTYSQDALLSTVDLSVLLNKRSDFISYLLNEYERKNNIIIPRRATVHDLGSGMTHKRIICIKRYVDGKSSDVIAKETYHSIQSVDRYLSQYDRIRHCRKQGMDQKEIAFSLNCSIRLVNEYFKIDDELERK